MQYESVHSLIGQVLQYTLDKYEQTLIR